MPICGHIQDYKVLLCSGSSAIASTHTFTFKFTDQCLRCYYRVVWMTFAVHWL